MNTRKTIFQTLLDMIRGPPPPRKPMTPEEKKRMEERQARLCQPMPPGSCGTAEMGGADEDEDD